MEKKSRFQLDMEIVSQALKRRSGMEPPQEEYDKLYQKFRTSKQEPVKLAIALQCYFSELVPDEQKQDYESYLQRRIRPAIQALIDEEAVGKIEFLEAKDWFGRRELEEFITTAREHQKTASLVWLLHLKNDKYGYEDADFSL